MRGIRQLVEYGFLPIITAARTWSDDQELKVVGEFVAMLKRVGYDRPRLKILPTLQLGAEVERTHAYHESERITAEMFAEFESVEL